MSFDVIWSQLDLIQFDSLNSIQSFPIIQNIPLFITEYLETFLEWLEGFIWKAESGILTRKHVKTNKKNLFWNEGAFPYVFPWSREYLYFSGKSIVSNMKRPLLHYYNT